MDTAQWPQGIGVVRAVENTRPTAEKKPRPLKEQALNCPRCNSTNTKFCYYNNYSLSQPRYFCKTCRRYWTEGGTLRSVPVGGGSRKNKRPSLSSSSSSSINSNSKIPNLSPPKFSPQNPKIQDGKDLNLGYNPTIFNGMSQFGSLPFGLDPKIFSNPHENPNYNPSSNIMSSSLTNTMPGSNYSASFMNPLHQHHDQVFKPSLNFSLDGLDQNINGGYANINLQSGVNQDHADSSSRTLDFPFEELKPVAASDDRFEMQDRGQAGDSSTNGYWINGMLPAGGMLGENNYI